MKRLTGKLESAKRDSTSFHEQMKSAESGAKAFEMERNEMEAEMKDYRDGDAKAINALLADARVSSKTIDTVEPQILAGWTKELLDTTTPAQTKLYSERFAALQMARERLSIIRREHTEPESPMGRTLMDIEGKLDQHTVLMDPAPQGPEGKFDRSY